MVTISDNDQYFIQDEEGKRLDFKNELIQNVLRYADNWADFVIYPSVKVDMHTSPALINKTSGEIYLPKPFIAPNTERTTKKESQWIRAFYWDTLFNTIALVLKGDKESIILAKGQIDNFEYLLKEFNFIPNFSDVISLNRSQPPFLSTMILTIYKKTQDKEWLRSKIEVAKGEYHNVWMKTKEESIQNHERYPNHRLESNLRLCNFSGRDIPGDEYAAEADSGLDSSSQYAHRTSDYLPVILNCCLLKYEKDFAEVAGILGDKEEEEHWAQSAARREREIINYMWDEEKGYFFDYDRRNKRKDTTYLGLTGFMPLWLGIVSPQQTKKIVEEYLPKFETAYGLMISAEDSIPSDEEMKKFLTVLKEAGMADRYQNTVERVFRKQQWDYPNIWAPIEYFVVMGLLKYGYKKEAQRIMENALLTLAKYYKEHNTLPEKINGKIGGSGGTFLYPDQEGFGWTNAFVKIMHHELEKIYQEETDESLI